MDLTSIAVIARKEIRDARRNRWFALFAAIFTGLSLILSLLGLSWLGSVGVTGFGRTAASLLNLVLLIVPLMGLLIGALSIAGEREQGTLLSLLAQPVTTHEVLLGKFLGLAAALAAALLLGFGLSALVIARYGGLAQVGSYLVLVGFTLLLGLVYLGIGCAVSVLAPRGSAAVGLAIALWLVCVFLSDLGLMGTAIVLRLAPRQLLWLSLLNPAQAFRLAAIDAMRGNLELLGPSALYAASRFGHGLLPALTGVLVAWVLIPFGLALRLFPRRGAL